MKSFKRWIALAPAAVVLLAGLPGCKTGANWFCHRQTSCATSEAACGNAKAAACTKSSKTACADSSKTACADASSKSCLGKQVSCASVSGCICGADGKGCVCGKGKTACASTECVVKSSSKTGCGSMGCVTMGKPECGPQGTMTTPKAVISQAQPNPGYEAPAVGQPIPFESHPVIVPQQAPTVNTELPILSEPLPEEQLQEFPIPAPPAEADASQLHENPFLRVSQIEESEGSEAAVTGNPFAPAEAAAEQPRPVGHQLSKPWADALGLPVPAPKPIENYRGN